jgi:gamma-glutamylaminecyclotransferase
VADKVKEPSDKGKIRVLVYGTLKKGHSNHILLEEADAEFIGYDSVTGHFGLCDMGAIPAVVDSTDISTVKGELWAIGPEGLASLDLLEGHPNLYARRKLVTDIHERRAWIYMLQATNWLPASPAYAKGGLWKSSDEEIDFWFQRGQAA